MKVDLKIFWHYGAEVQNLRNTYNGAEVEKYKAEQAGPNM